MGPYCNFCNKRCSVHLQPNVDRISSWNIAEEILHAYGTSTIIATCTKGQLFEKEKIGWCYDDLQKLRKEEI